MFVEKRFIQDPDGPALMVGVHPRTLIMTYVPGAAICMELPVKENLTSESFTKGVFLAGMCKR